MIILSLGSNLDSTFGNRKDNLNLAIAFLEGYGIKVEKKSSFYETPSYPDKSLPRFLNLIILVNTELPIVDLMSVLIHIETKLERVRKLKNGPRTCDIDIIDFNGLIKRNKLLELPHPRSHTRNFVLYPIKEIDPKWIHPIFKKNVDFLINELSQNSRIEITRLRKSVII